LTAHASAPWRRNVFAVTAASFMGYTGFTLVGGRCCHFVQCHTD
jgi:hypothetical protein